MERLPRGNYKKEFRDYKCKTLIILVKNRGMKA